MQYRSELFLFFFCVSSSFRRECKFAFKGHEDGWCMELIKEWINKMNSYTNVDFDGDSFDEFHFKSLSASAIIILIWLGDWFLITNRPIRLFFQLFLFFVESYNLRMPFSPIRSLIPLSHNLYYDFCFIFNFFFITLSLQQHTMNIFSVKRKWQGLIMAMLRRSNRQQNEREAAKKTKNQSFNSIVRVFDLQGTCKMVDVFTWRWAVN